MLTMNEAHPTKVAPPITVIARIAKSVRSESKNVYSYVAAAARKLMQIGSSADLRPADRLRRKVQDPSELLLQTDRQKCKACS